MFMLQRMHALNVLGAADGLSLVGVSATNNGSGDTTNLVIDKPAGVLPGDLLIAFTSRSGVVSFSNGLGDMVKAVESSGLSPTIAVWTKTAGGSEPATYFFNANIGAGGTANGGVILAFRKATATPVVGAMSNTNPPSAPSITMTGAGKLLTALFSNGGAPTLPAGSVAVSESTGNPYLNWRIGMENIAAGATGARTSAVAGTGVGVLVGPVAV